MQTIKENNEQVHQLAAKAWDKFYAQATKEDNLNDKSVAALMGVSRQTIKNWSTRHSQPCMGTVMRIKMVAHALDKARNDGLLPATTRNKQDELVKEILK